MCLLLEKSQLERLIAEEDIPVLKLIKKDELGRYVTLFMDSRVNFNTIIKSYLEMPHNNVSPLCEADERLYKWPYIGVSRGIHVFDNEFLNTENGNKIKKELKGCSYDVLMISGLIPKGSEYYHNPTIHSIATNQVIYMERFVEI